MKFFCIFLSLFLFVPSVSAKTTFPDQSTCDFQVFRTDVPDIKEKYTIQIISTGAEIPETRQVGIRYNGSRKSVVCNGSWTRLGGTDDFPDMFMCSVDRTGNIMPNTSIIGSLEVSNPFTYRNTHPHEPALDYPTLKETSPSNPFCDSDEYSRECKYQVQNLNNANLNAKGVPINEWVVFSKTTVSNFKIGYTVDDSFIKPGDIVCGEDIIGDGRVTNDIEYSFCMRGQPIYLCPRDAISCFNEKPAGCSIGHLDTELDKCIDNLQCPGPGNFDQSQKICISELEEVCAEAIPPDPPICTMQCPSEYSLVTRPDLTQYCTNRSPFCASGTLVRSSTDGWYCRIGNPICLEGGIYHNETNFCYPPGYPCPYGEEFGCTRVSGYSSKMCSKFPCSEVTVPGSPEGSNDKKNDGVIDSKGECKGTIYIFNGTDRRCRDGGLRLAWDSCCKDEEYFVGLAECRNSEKELAKLKKEDLCHAVGSYCSTRLNFIGGSVCAETSESYCCFNSKLAKIIHEQGRPQLKTFGRSVWGSGSSPECRGFTPDEFQNLDFSKIDLSEWYADIEVTSQTQITESITDGVNKFYDKIY